MSRLRNRLIPPWLAAVSTVLLLFALWYAAWAFAAGFGLWSVIQHYPDELDYVNAQLDPRSKCGHFLEHFFQACLHADEQNYELLRPLLLEFIVKYPALPDLLEAERRDHGACA